MSAHNSTSAPNSERGSETREEPENTEPTSCSAEYQELPHT